MISKKAPLICPACEVYPLRLVATMKARCSGCGFTFGGQILKTLFEILTLPEALGNYACEECGQPQMRLLPDGVSHCPGCCAEVTPVSIRGAQ